MKGEDAVQALCKPTALFHKERHQTISRSSSIAAKIASRRASSVILGPHRPLGKGPDHTLPFLWINATDDAKLVRSLPDKLGIIGVLRPVQMRPENPGSLY